METEAAKKLLPHIDMLLEMLEVEPYIVAPIVSDEKWNCYVNRLDTYGEMPTPTRSVISEITSRFFVHEVFLTANCDYSQADLLLTITCNSWIFGLFKLLLSIEPNVHILLFNLVFHFTIQPSVVCKK